MSSKALKKLKNNPASVVIQIIICLLYLSVLLVAHFRNVFPYYWRWILLGSAIVLTIIQGFRVKCPLLLIDRIFADKPNKQIILAVFAFCIALDLGLCIFPTESIRHTFIGFVHSQRVLQDTQPTFHYEPEQEITDPKKYVIIKDAPHSDEIQYVKDALIWFLGMIIFNGLLIATINRYMTTRAERFKRGANTYKNIKNHYLIIGYGDICVPIIRNIRKRPGTDKSAYYLILSNQNIEMIRRSIQTQLQDAEETVVIYSGDMNSFSHLKRLNIGEAREVFVLGEKYEPSRDSMNLECARAIKDIRAKKDCDEALHVNIQFDKPTSYSTIKRITIPKTYYRENDRDVTYLRPFNFYENWSRLLWGTYHLDCYQPLDQGHLVEVAPDGTLQLTKKHVHLVIAGFDEMGTALLLEALRLCHFPNYNETTGENKTTITIIDPKIPALLPRFKSQYPYLSQIKDINLEFKTNHIEDYEIREMLDRLANDEEVLLTVAICFYDSDTSLSSALSLPDSVYYHVVDKAIVPNDTAQVLVRQEIRKGLADLLDVENGKYSNVKIFGTLEKGIDDQLLDDKMAMCVGAYYHCKYDLDTPVDFFELAKSDSKQALQIAEANWANLNEDKRFANRYQVEIYKTYQTYRKLLEQSPDLLYQTEHMRWCAERSIAGYRNLSKEGIKKNYTYQIHNLIIPYYDLDLKEKNKDRDVLEIMDKILSLQQIL